MNNIILITSQLLLSSMKGKLTKAGTTVWLQIVTMATLAAVAQTFIVGAVTQDTDVLTATVVSAARVHHCVTIRRCQFSAWCKHWK